MSTKQRKYVSNFRDEKPTLHAHYVSNAIIHLHEIEKMLSKLDSFAYVPLCEVQLSLYKAKEKLIKEDAAYEDANKLLKSLNLNYDKLGE